jgi:hypothetical protein
MRLTGYNVAGGLTGFYILLHPDVEDQMKKLQAKEIFVILDKNVSNIYSLDISTIYRIRFLNANYGEGSTVKYSFNYGNCANPGPPINFTIIGTYSSLFHKGLYDQQIFEP